ncbi:MAG: hypothetical protein II486_04450, partial [Thermoguttaceae bacterium]|nr:hypothetical protein [Thermoguttaceae bacterium]
VDTEVAKDVAGKYRVGGIPHTFFFLDGEEYTNVLGCNPLKINAAIEAMLNGDPAPEPDAPGAGGDGEDDAEEDVDKDAEDEAVDLEFDEEDAGAEEQDDAE